MEELTREIKRPVPKGAVFRKADARTPADADASDGRCSEGVSDSNSATCPASRDASCDSSQPHDVVTEAREKIVAEPPVVLSRDVLASQADSQTFAKQLSAAAGALGFR